MASNQSAEDLEKKINRLESRLAQTTAVLEDPDKTKRQLQINLNHIERHINAIKEYETFVSEENPLNYANLTDDVFEKAEECTVELIGYLEAVSYTHLTLPTIYSV